MGIDPHRRTRNIVRMQCGRGATRIGNDHNGEATALQCVYEIQNSNMTLLEIRSRSKYINAILLRL